MSARSLLSLANESRNIFFSNFYFQRLVIERTLSRWVEKFKKRLIPIQVRNLGSRGCTSVNCSRRQRVGRLEMFLEIFHFHDLDIPFRVEEVNEEGGETREEINSASRVRNVETGRTVGLDASIC